MTAKKPFSIRAYVKDLGHGEVILRSSKFRLIIFINGGSQSALIIVSIDVFPERGIHTVVV